MKESKAYFIYLISTIILWSFTPATAKLVLGELNGLQLLFYTCIFGTGSLFLVVLFQGKLKKIKEFEKKDYLKMFWMGFLGIFLYYFLLYEAFDISPAGQANVVNYLWPVFIVIFSIFILKEKFNIKTIVSIMLSFLGAFVIFTGGNFYVFKNQFEIGYLLAFFAAICSGLFAVLGKKLHYDKFTSMLFYYIFATIIVVPLTLIFSDIVLPYSIKAIVALFVLGGVLNSVGLAFWFKALHKGHTHKTANAIYAVPFLALIWTYFLNSEPIGYFSFIGLALIVIGIIIQTRNKV